MEVARPEAKKRLEQREPPRLALAWMPGGVTDSDMAILRALAETGSEPLTLDDLAEATGYSKRTVRRRATGLKMSDEIREGGLLSDDENGGVWFKSIDVAEKVGEFFVIRDARKHDE